MIQLKYYTCLLMMVIAMVSSCTEKDDDNSPDKDNTPVPTGKYFFHLHSYIDESEVDLYNITYTSLDGRDVSLSLAQLYISEVELVKLDGSVQPVSGPLILKVLDKETYYAGDVPVGNYKSVRFKVGLTPAMNDLVPGDSPDSLLLNRPEMWFGSSPQPDSYVFMNVSGSIDTSSSLNGSMAQFNYRIGTDSHYMQVQMPDRNFSIVENQVEYGHVIIDFLKLFSGIQVNVPSNLSVLSPLDNMQSHAARIADNIPLMFRYEM